MKITIYSWSTSTYELVRDSGWGRGGLVAGGHAGGGGAVGDEAGDGAVGVGQSVSAGGPAGQLLPALEIGQGVFDGDAVGCVPMASRSQRVQTSGSALLFGFRGCVIAWPG